VVALALVENELLSYHDLGHFTIRHAGAAGPVLPRSHGGPAGAFRTRSGQVIRQFVE
jgi:hypothetical protein